MPKTLVHPQAKSAAKPKKHKGRPKGSYNRKFGLPVKEAKAPLAMPLLQVDIDRAQKVKPEDVNAPENFLSCVIAQAATRAWGAERVAILRETAYVAFPGEKHTKRYTIDSKSRKVLEAWDRGEPVLEGVELRLMPPTKGKTRTAQLKRNREWRQQHGSSETFPGGRKTAQKRRKPDPLHNVVRNGNLVRWS